MPLPTNGTLKWFSGFGHGLATATPAGPWSSSSGGGSTSGGRNGYALTIATAASTAYTQLDFATGDTIWVVSGYIRMTSLPANGTITFIELYNTTEVVITLAWQQTTGQLNLWHEALASGIDFGPTIAANTWYLVEFAVSLGGTTHYMRASVDGGTEATWSDNRGSGNSMNYIRFGNSGAEGSCTRLYDDFVIWSTNYDAKIGHHAVASLSPASDGTHSTGTAEFTGAVIGAISDVTTNAYTELDTVPPQTSTAYINQASTGVSNYTEHKFATLGTYYIDSNTVVKAGVPVGLSAFGMSKDAASTNSTPAQSRIYDAANNLLYTIRPTADPGTTDTFYPVQAVDPARVFSPAAGSTLDYSYVSGLKLRAGYGDGAPDSRFGGHMLEVLLLPPTLAFERKGARTIRSAMSVPEVGW